MKSARLCSTGGKGGGRGGGREGGGWGGKGFSVPVSSCMHEEQKTDEEEMACPLGHGPGAGGTARELASCCSLGVGRGWLLLVLRCLKY